MPRERFSALRASILGFPGRLVAAFYIFCCNVARYSKTLAKHRFSLGVSRISRVRRPSKPWKNLKKLGKWKGNLKEKRKKKEIKKKKEKREVGEGPQTQLSGLTLRRYLYKGRLWGIRNQAFFEHGPKMGSKRPFGSILEGLGKGLGRVWGRIWEDLVPFQQFVGKFWTYLKRFGPAGVDSIIGPPR